MGRPRTNESNWWRGDEAYENKAMSILEAAAKNVCGKCDPLMRGMVEPGDLISIGWYCVMRYVKPKINELSQIHWNVLYHDCFREMKKRFDSMRRDQWTRKKLDTKKVTFDTICYELYAEDPILPWELWEQVQQRATKRQKLIVCGRLEGKGGKEIANELGLTPERCRQLRMELMDEIEME